MAWFSRNLEIKRNHLIIITSPFFFLMFLFKDNFKQSEKKSIGEKIRVYNAVIRFMVGTVLLGKELHYPR